MPSSRGLPDSGIEPTSPVSPALQILYWWATGEAQFYVYFTTFFKNWKQTTQQKRSPFFKCGAFSAVFFRYCERTGWLGQQYLLGKLCNLEAVSRDLWGWVKGMWGAGGPLESEALTHHGLTCPYLLQRYRRLSWTSTPILGPHGSFLEPSHPQTIVGRHF